MIEHERGVQPSDVLHAEEALLPVCPPYVNALFCQRLKHLLVKSVCIGLGWYISNGAREVDSEWVATWSRVDQPSALLQFSSPLPQPLPPLLSHSPSSTLSSILNARVAFELGSTLMALAMSGYRFSKDCTPEAS